MLNPCKAFSSFSMDDISVDDIQKAKEFLWQKARTPVQKAPWLYHFPAAPKHSCTLNRVTGRPLSQS